MRFPQNRRFPPCRCFAELLALAWLSTIAASLAAVPGVRPLWEIGVPDRNNAEFALAPNRYREFERDGFFVVGQSSAAKDWTYVHPGPADSWAGARPHTFTVVFGLASRIKPGTCRLELDLLDTHAGAPPKLRVFVNGTSFETATPSGAGDASIFGEPAKGKPHQVQISFDSALLARGNNRITLTTVAGSWCLYDSVRLLAPESAALVPVETFTEFGACWVESGLLKTEIVHAGAPGDAQLSLDGKKVNQLRLESGRQTIDSPVPAVERPRKASLALTTRGRRACEREILLTPGVREIIVVFKTHFDIGYTDMASNVVATYRTRFMDSALEVVDQSRALPSSQQFVWTIPGWPMHKILEDWPGQTPDRQRRIRQALVEGRFVLHALPFTTHTELLEPEDLVRGLSYSSGISSELGLPPARDAKMTDVPEHAAMLATLLHHSGVVFMHIGCNAMSGSPQVPPLYWWEGPDGSRVLTMYSPDYGTGLFPPPEWPHRTWLALLHTGDNHGPPRPEEVKQVIDEVAKRRPGIKVRIGRLADFGDAILAENPDLPVVRADMPDTWIHGPMSDPAGAAIARNTRPLLPATEALNTQLRGWGVAVQNAAPIISAAYEQSLLYGEHTWGGSIGWLKNKLSYGEDFVRDRAAGKFQRIEGSWDEHTAYILKARDLIRPALEQNLAALAASVKADRPSVVVFNPLPWKRTAMVRLEASSSNFGAVAPADGGEATPVAAIAGGIEFLARDIPALGYRTFIPVKAELPVSQLGVDATAATIESPFFKAVIDPQAGAVRSLIDKRTRRELVDQGAVPGFGAHLYERFDHGQVWDYIRAYLKNPSWTIDFDKPGMPPASETRYRSLAPTGFKVSFERTATTVAATWEASPGNGIPHGLRTRLVLYEQQPFADLEITVKDKPFESWPEAGWVCFPFKIERPQFRVGRLGNIIDPASDIIAGANRHILGITTGVAIFGRDHSGVGLCPLDHPLVSLESPGCWKFSRDFVPGKPVVWVNLFNNQWNTNFRLWNSGTWTSRVRLWSFSRYTPDAGLVIPALEARNPFLAAPVSGSSGGLRSSQRGVEVSRPGVVVAAFGQVQGSDAVTLRLWEFCGESGPVTVRLPEASPHRFAVPVDLRGKAAGPRIPIRDGSFRFDLKGFAPASFNLEPPLPR
jgi:hypothetical protein